MRNKTLVCKLFLFASSLLLIQPCAFAAWKAIVGANSFYTTDVSIFSASQRLSLSEDPTSPIIDKTGQGSSFVFEPSVLLANDFHNAFGKLEIKFNAKGYVFTNHSEFNHPTFGTNILQTLSSSTSIGLRYHFGPNQFLGRSRSSGIEEEIENSSKRLGNERVTTHFGSLFLQHRLDDRLLFYYAYLVAMETELIMRLFHNATPTSGPLALISNGKLPHTLSYYLDIILSTDLL